MINNDNRNIYQVLKFLYGLREKTQKNENESKTFGSNTVISRI